VPRCRVCGEDQRLIAKAIAVCGACLRAGSAKSRGLAIRAHARPRREIGLPEVAPRDPATRACEVCANHCQPSEGQRGLCGARAAAGGRVGPTVGTAQAAAVFWQQFPLPTNCCARWVCPGSSASGYPRYSYTRGPERGYQSLAVGYYGCTFDCLYCQSCATRSVDGAPRYGAQELADAMDGVSCACLYGGDPTPQLAHALAAAKIARAKARAQGRKLRICFETNGAMNRKLLRAMADVSLESGGCIKVDLKAWSDDVHQALCGASNAQTLANFAWLAGRRRERPRVPLLVGSTALVPGYVDVEEISAIARFVAAQGKDIPYLLIGFFSCHHLADVPNTSLQQARRCLAAARAAGLENVRLDNRQLLRDAPEEALPRRRKR
jgi:pyruvate formate lyase activating enzyme